MGLELCKEDLVAEVQRGWHIVGLKLATPVPVFILMLTSSKSLAGRSQDTTMSTADEAAGSKEELSLKRKKIITVACNQCRSRKSRVSLPYKRHASSQALIREAV